MLTGKVRNFGVIESGVTENNDVLSLNVCPRLVKIKPDTSFARIPVKVCNLTAKPVTIYPNNSLYNLPEVQLIL